MSCLSAVTVSLLLVLPAVATSQGLVPANPDSGTVAAIFETKDAAARTVGLSPLSAQQMRRGDREVRIWYSGFGNPQLLVLIRQNGNKLTGRLLLWWDQYYLNSPDSADTRVDNFVRANYACGPISKRNSEYGEDRWISSVCEAKLKGTPDWRSFLAEVESHALPGAPVDKQAEDETSEPENLGITVERRSGNSYGVSHYHTALMIGTPEPGRGPKLQDLVNALAATAKHESALAQTR
ncbi:MAG TPA: hypothetical protein VFS56_11185 [Gemmatimonadaceae bacterium]|nr:hypothetical protein [Gemmatimonadaceae bacterium]